MTEDEHSARRELCCCWPSCDACDWQTDRDADDEPAVVTYLPCGYSHQSTGERGQPSAPSAAGVIRIEAPGAFCGAAGRATTQVRERAARSAAPGNP